MQLLQVEDFIKHQLLVLSRIVNPLVILTNQTLLSCIVSMTLKNTNYLITKRSTKNSALVVYSFTDGVDSFSSTTVRYGYAQKISKDLITSAYKTSTSSSSKSKLLVATNESGMVDITINHDSVTSNTTGNGSTSDFEEYIF
jgi:hypothetical protein